MRDATDAPFIGDAVARYERPLMAYALRMLGDIDSARDVVQDTFLRLWQADVAALDGRLAPWLFTVCRHRAVDTIRRRRRSAPMVEDPGMPIEPPRGEERAERCRELRGRLACLSARQQEVLRLRFQGGLSYREIADVMDLTVTHVGVIIHKAVRELREQMAPTEEEAGAGPAGVSS